MTVCPPPNAADHNVLCAWAESTPTLSSIRLVDTTAARKPNSSAPHEYRGWISVRLGSRVPFVWQLQWARIDGPFLLLFASDKPSARMLRAVYLPGTTAVPLLPSHPDACKRTCVLYLESMYGAYLDESEEEAPLLPSNVLVDQRRTFLDFDNKEEMYRWKLKVHQIGATRSEFTGIRCGAPQSVNHLIHLNEKPSSAPGRTREGGTVVAAPQPLRPNFGAALLSEDMFRWLRAQGLTDEDLSHHTAKEWSDMREIAEGTSDRVGPQSKLKQFRSMVQKRKVTIGELVAKESLEQLYSDLVLIDQGSQGKVYRGVCKNNKIPVAVKKIVLKNEATELPPLVNEIAVLSACDHPNVVRLFSCHRAGKEISIVMELMSGGKLTDILDEEEGAVTFAEREIAVVMYHVLQGLLYLHADGFMHRDIKSDNILVNENGDIKLGDFGFATCVLSSTSDTVASRKTLVGTPYWMAPEITKGQEYDFKADVWSVGILFLELCDGLPPWMGMNPIKALSKISLSPPPRISGKKRQLSLLAHEFASFVLVKDPTKRPTCAEVLQHPFLAEASRTKGKDRAFLQSYVRMLLAKRGKAKR